MITHEMRYRAGRHGFTGAGLPDQDPHWTCTCDTGWTFPAQAMPTRKAGNNEIEAKRAHVRHAGAIR